MYASIIDMHDKMAGRDNASRSVVCAMAHLGKPMYEAIAAGLLTLGGGHAPIKRACELFNADNWDDQISTMYNMGGRIPGFGSAWYKEEPDPVVEELLDKATPSNLKKVTSMTEWVQLITDRKLFPNAALATAVAAKELELTPTSAQSLIIAGRLPAWTAAYNVSYVEYFYDQ